MKAWPTVPPRAPKLVLMVKRPWKVKFAATRPSIETRGMTGTPTLTGYVHSFQVGSAVDGPGIRAVVFLAGCPLRCQYCHNPDSWDRHHGQAMSSVELMKLLKRYEKPLKMGKGGVTLTGGEPLMQHKFARSILHQCKALALHTALDTSGYLGAKLSDPDLLDIDLMLLDLKAGDPDTCLRVTGHELQPTLDFAKRLSRLNRPTWVRFVLVPGLTDAPDHVARVADLAASIRSLERVEVLPFHQMGRDKWQRLGLDYALADVNPPDPETLARTRAIFEARGLAVY